MAKASRKRTGPTKKHLARLEKEKLQTRYLLIGSIAVLVIVVGLILYGILDQTVLLERRAVAIVNSEKISVREFQAQTRYTRYTLVTNAMQVYQLVQLFGGDPATAGSFISQLQQIQAMLEPTNVGDQVLNKMVDDILIRQEAEKMGITVTEEEIEKAFEAAFQYFPDGTPTSTPTSPPIPTSTLSPLQMTLIPPTPTATITPTVEITPTLTITSGTNLTVTLTPTNTAEPTFTATPTEMPTATEIPTETPTATPYTYEDYQKLYDETMARFLEEYEVSEADLRYVIEMQLYRQKVMDAVLADLPRTQEQVWALHILVDEEALANEIFTKLNDGEEWSELAATYSKDTSNKDIGGDLGWFGRGRMVPEFEEAAFSMKIGETSKPVKTDFGWHIIRVLGHEERPVSSTEYAQLRQTKFQEWLDQIRETAEIEIKDFWFTIVPQEPNLPPELEGFIQSQQGAGPSAFPQPAP